MSNIKISNNLVNDILELSKLQNNPNSLNIERYDLVAEINNIISKYGIIKETEKYVIATEMPIKAYVLADKKRNDVENFVCNRCKEYHNNKNEIIDHRILDSRTKMYKTIEDRLYEELEDNLTSVMQRRGL